MNGCLAFVGKNGNLRFCSQCETPRFYNCAHRTCADKALKDCKHKISSLTARKQVFYYPLLSLLDKLVSLPKFRSELENFDAFSNFYRKEDEYTDISDGIVAKHAMNEMKTNFQHNRNEGDDCEMVNVLLGVFYDGANLFDRKLNSFNAIVMNIINLPVSYRITNGAGAFVVGLQTVGTDHCDVKSLETAEKVLFRKYLLQELKLLKQGVQLMTKDGKKIFLQARLLVNLYDTPAFEKMFGVQCRGTKAY